MKTNTSTQGSIRHALIALSVVGSLSLAHPLLSQDSIVIEGGPNEIQISDRDGKPEPVRPSARKFDKSVPVVPALTPPEAVTVQPVPNSDVTVLVPVEKPGEKQSIIEAQPPAGVPRLAQVDVEKQKKLAALERDLKISDSATMAKVSFKAESLFEADSGLIDPLAKPTLIKLATYAELSDFKKGTLRYYYAAGVESESEARAKATILANFFKTEGKAYTTDLVIADPQPAVQPTARVGEDGPLARELVSIVEFVLE